jgi:hypothetical protein
MENTETNKYYNRIFDTIISYVYEKDISQWPKPKTILELLNQLPDDLQNKLFHTKYTNDDPILIYLLRKYENNFNKSMYDFICFGVQKFPDILSSKDKNGVTPLMIASLISENDKSTKIKGDMLSCLINSGANANDVDNFNRNALMFAISKGSEHATNKLLRAGVNILHKDNNNMNSLDYALNQSNDKITNVIKNKLPKNIKKDVVFTCEICGKDFDVLKKKNLHMNEHYNPSVKDIEDIEDIEDITKILEGDTPVKTLKRKSSSISPGLLELSPFELSFPTEEYDISTKPRSSKKLFKK